MSCEVNSIPGNSECSVIECKCVAGVCLKYNLVEEILTTNIKSLYVNTLTDISEKGTNKIEEQ